MKRNQNKILKPNFSKKRLDFRFAYFSLYNDFMSFTYYGDMVQ